MKQDLAEQMAGLQPSVCLRCFGERVCRGDWQLGPGRRHGAIELLELTDTGNAPGSEWRPDLVKQAGKRSKPSREVGVLTRTSLSSAIASMATAIQADLKDATSLAIVGIQSRGVPLAARLADALRKNTKKQVDVGSLDITLYRDDLSTVGTRPILKATHIPFSIDGRPVILVDDVLYTGRTIRAALDELVDFGRPSRIALAVLIDRGHRELPIQADYVGKTVTTARADMVDVRLTEIDGKDEVVLVKR